MIILITGASHTGKTVLAQRMLEKYRYPYLSIVSCKFFLEKVAGIFGECCISVLEKVATPWSGRCHPMEADILC